MSTSIEQNLNSEVNYITKEDVKIILASYNSNNEEIKVDNYVVHNASDKMLGFLADYWRVRVHLSNRKVLYFFVKAISRSNAAKASMVREMHLFDKEAFFYSVIKKKIEVPGKSTFSIIYDVIMYLYRHPIPFLKLRQTVAQGLVIFDIL